MVFGEKSLRNVLHPRDCPYFMEHVSDNSVRGFKDILDHIVYRYGVLYIGKTMVSHSGTLRGVEQAPTRGVAEHTQAQSVVSPLYTTQIV